MNNVLLEIKYNGSNYCGYQVQKNGVTITEKIQDAIEKLYLKREDVIGCSRTDSKVHANQYFLNFHTERHIEEKRLPMALNRFLPDDIVVLSAKYVDEDFHSRYCCTGKEYVYKILNHQYRDPFALNTAFMYPKNIDVELMNYAASQFVGTYDFVGFCSAKNTVEDTVRTITECYIKKENDFVYIYVKGDGFLYNMVRIIVGTLLFVNEGKINADDIKKNIAEKDRSKAGKTSPPQGLYLNKIFY